MELTDRVFFQRNGFINLGKVLDDDEVAHFHELYEEDLRSYPYF